MVSLFFLECLFIGIAFLHSSPAFAWFRIAWVWGIPFTLILSLMMDLADKGVTAIDTPFFLLCLRYALGLSLLASCALLLRRYWRR
ncbi:hypothetical protein [Providencia sp. PROV117]|uniref:hypothetical protein n=1 Tax=Providencia sp. PROV117 TaxID=2949828 RepID=UPI0023497CA3|nr:hypothetical protein [Providencia sp. PROV117]